jgi:hypothetical protein
MAPKASNVHEPLRAWFRYDSSPVYTECEGHTLFTALRFLWNATRGHRFAPWRSEYLRWRVETYSGQRAESLTPRKIFKFIWTSRWELLSFLAWTGHLDKEVRKRA